MTYWCHFAAGSYWFRIGATSGPHCKIKPHLGSHPKYEYVAACEPCVSSFFVLSLN